MNNPTTDSQSITSQEFIDKFRNMDVCDLLVISCLNQSHNLASVADLLNMSQSAVSQRIRKIQNNSKGRIFTKKGRSIELTQEGNELANRITPALKFLQDGGLAEKNIQFSSAS
jgi:DNA-binding transcriptional LysR family regulator